MIITITLPTRERPANLMRCVRALFETADEPESVEVICAVDDDDEMSESALYRLENKYFENFKWTTGPRIPYLSQLHNHCLSLANRNYEIAGFWGDDCVMETKGWDTIVRKAFLKYDDRILLCGGSDGVNAETICHGFISREWITVTDGNLMPSNYMADWSDSHLGLVAKALGRHERLSFFNRHLHPSVYTEIRPDQTYIDKTNRGNMQNTGGLFYSAEMVDYRQKEIEKLQSYINNFGKVA